MRVWLIWEDFSPASMQVNAIEGARSGIRTDNCFAYSSFRRSLRLLLYAV